MTEMNLYYCKDLRDELIKSRERPCYYNGERYTLRVKSACLARQAVQRSLETLTVFKYYYEQNGYKGGIDGVIEDVNTTIPEIYLGAWLTTDDFRWEREYKVRLVRPLKYGLVLKYPVPVLNSAAYFLGHLRFEFSYEEERKHYKRSYDYVLNSMYGDLLADKRILKDVLDKEFKGEGE